MGETTDMAGGKTDWEALARQFASGEVTIDEDGEPTPSAPAPTEVIYQGGVDVQRVPPPGTEAISGSEAGADVLDIGVASLAQDPKAQIRYLARQRGIPETRYAMIDGEIAYEADDGKWYKEVPDMDVMDPTTIMQSTATGVGPAVSIVPPAVVGVATAPLMATGVGTAASVGLTAAAGAGAQAGREGLASYFMDQPVSPGRIVRGGVEAGAGQGVGKGLTAWAERGLAKDIGKLAPHSVRKLERRASEEGIDLTPAEITDLPSLKAQQKALGNLPQSADEMGGYYRRRTEQVKGAIQRLLDRISPVDSAEVTGDLARSASKGAMGDVAANRAAQAKPLYKRAFDGNPDVDVASVINNIDEELKIAKGGIKTALQRARALLHREVDDVNAAGEKIIKTIPEDRLDALHQAKMALDDMINNTADTSVGRTARGRLKTVMRDLLGHIDAASPDYAEARAVFADLSPGTVRVAEGLVGKVAGLSDRMVKDAARTFLGPSSGPRAIQEARRLITKKAPEVWQAIKRSYLQDLFEKAQKETLAGGANVAGKFRQAVMGDVQQAARLKAALTSREWFAVRRLSRVLDAASSVKHIGSDTAWNQEAMKMMRDKARPALAKIVRNINPAQALRSFDEWLTERNVAKNASRLANIITGPESMSTLKELQKLPVGSIRARILIGHLLTVSTAGAAEAGIDALELELEPTGP
jgi:hypothetical protein